ncbi:hypothetical protein CBL_20958, partial [Carabus blaptoides fortunei]
MDATLGTVNVDGIRRKKPLIDNLLSQDHVLVLGITETKINYNLRIKGYQVFQRNFRKNITCGGVALAIHHTIPAEPLIIPDQLHHIQLVGATIFSKAGPVTFI